MNGCVVAEKTLVCYKRDDKPRTNKQARSTTEIILAPWNVSMRLLG